MRLQPLRFCVRATNQEPQPIRGISAASEGDFTFMRGKQRIPMFSIGQRSGKNLASDDAP